MRFVPGLTIVAIALTVFPAITERAQAQPADRRQQAVRYGDLNLASEAGARILADRIDRAAKVVCDTGGGRLTVPRDAAECRRQAIARAIGDLASRPLAPREVPLAGLNGDEERR